VNQPGSLSHAPPQVDHGLFSKSARPAGTDPQPDTCFCVGSGSTGLSVVEEPVPNLAPGSLRTWRRDRLPSLMCLQYAKGPDVAAVGLAYAVRPTLPTRVLDATVNRRDYYTVCLALFRSQSRFPCLQGSPQHRNPGLSVLSRRRQRAWVRTQRACRRESFGLV